MKKWVYVYFHGSFIGKVFDHPSIVFNALQGAKNGKGVIGTFHENDRQVVYKVYK